MLHRSLFFVSILCLAPESLRAQLFEPSEIFARAVIGAWSLEAGTTLDPDSTTPRIHDIACTARNEDVRVTRRADRRIQLDFSDRSGSGHSVFDISRIRIGAREYSARPQDVRFPEIFTDVDYGPSDNILLSDFHGYLAIEIGPGLWAPAEILIDDMVRGAAVSVLSDADDDSGPRWKRIDTARLAEAVGWCDAAIVSDDARRFSARGTQP